MFEEFGSRVRKRLRPSKFRQFVTDGCGWINSNISLAFWSPLPALRTSKSLAYFAAGFFERRRFIRPALSLNYKPMQRKSEFLLRKENKPLSFSSDADISARCRDYVIACLTCDTTSRKSDKFCKGTPV